ncbi:MAG: hypothetical protein A2X51_15105 [Candidatus Rokubacteria bacterium GWC2_70_24]|nr:MAG: hypothetical protein A2X53_14870 [Candidatus Rokubacteria bacterium GWA2_70_23]OGK88641.1 MAG: hypothetical protein A2X51_15105 [Candidatus Rokubacteria bacterium GWC2_70_24]OGK90940.1 MAG: hypothetical protein A2X50_14060 [Candidatus Rokubacteria bacterium GWF2_70_14]
MSEASDAIVPSSIVSGPAGAFRPLLPDAIMPATLPSVIVESRPAGALLVVERLRRVVHRVLGQVRREG